MLDSQWDKNLSEKVLEKWLYGKQSLKGATRSWFIKEAGTWDSGTTMLDAGCGGGVTAFQMGQAGLLGTIKYEGVDASEKMLSLARRKTTPSPAMWTRADLSEFSPGKKYDVVLLRAVLAHLDDPWAVLENVASLVSRPSGKLFIVFWNNPVRGFRSVLGTAPGGFPDHGHPAAVLRKHLIGIGMIVVDELTFKEKSAHDDKRIVWIVRPFK